MAKCSSMATMCSTTSPPTQNPGEPSMCGGGHSLHDTWGGAMVQS